MQIVSIANNKVTFREKESDLLFVEKYSDEIFLLHTSGGIIRFEKNDTLLNNASINSVDDVLALSPQVFIKPAKWRDLYQALRNNTSLINKMRTANGMGGSLACVFSVIQCGIDGFPDEQGLQQLLNLNGWGFTNPEKTQINNYFSNHDFNISIS